MTRAAQPDHAHLRVSGAIGRQRFSEGGKNTVTDCGASVGDARTLRQHGARDTPFIKPTDEIYFANAGGQRSENDGSRISSELCTAAWSLSYKGEHEGDHPRRSLSAQSVHGEEMSKGSLVVYLPDLPGTKAGIRRSLHVKFHG